MSDWPLACMVADFGSSRDLAGMSGEGGGVVRTGSSDSLAEAASMSSDEPLPVVRNHPFLSYGTIPSCVCMKWTLLTAAWQLSLSLSAPGDVDQSRWPGTFACFLMYGLRGWMFLSLPCCMTSVACSSLQIVCCIAIPHRQDNALPGVQTDAPLQNFAGSIMLRPGEGQHARYTHFNGLECTTGGRMVEKKRGRCEGGFCRFKVGARPLLPSIRQPFYIDIKKME